MGRNLRRTGPVVWAISALVLSAATAISAGTSRAETNFPVIGGSGNGSFEDHCPAQQYLVEIRGRTGAWVDQVQLVCEKVWIIPRNGPLGGGYYTDDAANWYLGPTRGGDGGGPARGGCGGNPITGLQVAMTTGNRQVKFVDISCLGLNNSRLTSARLTGGVSPTTNLNTGPDRPSFQGCPSGEVGVGLRGRYGQDVNALALICDAFVTPDATYAVMHHGNPAPAAATPPPPSGPPLLPTSLFAGGWTTVASGVNHYTLIVTALQPDPGPGRPITLYFRGTFVDTDGKHQYDGILQGQAINGSPEMTFTYAVPALNLSGQGSFYLQSNGNTFVGHAVQTPGAVKFDWNGTRAR
jgi:hypothetical protein